MRHTRGLETSPPTSNTLDTEGVTRTLRTARIGPRFPLERALTKSFFGMRASGERIEVRGCDLFEFSDGKISRKDSFWKIVD